MDPKALLLEQLKPKVIEQMRAEITKGKLDPSRRYDFDSSFERIYSAWASDAILGTAMRAFKVTKEDLKRLVKECLVEVGVQL